jgi:hypothetical protein
MDEDLIKKLNGSVDRLNVNIERQTSFKFVILRGLVYGVSIVIGTTILAGIVISVLNDVPIIEDIIKTFRIKNN